MTSHRTGNLESSLCVATGARVMLTCNLNLDDSLCNGKIAVLKKVQLTSGEPVILWLHFENSDVGQLQRIKHHRLYRDGIQSNWVPIFNISQSFDVLMEQHQLELPEFSFLSFLHLLSPFINRKVSYFCSFRERILALVTNRFNLK